MKKQFVRFLLLLNAFFISYAYGLNTCRVKVVDPSLPPLVIKKPEVKPAETKKPQTKPTPAKPAAATAHGAPAGAASHKHGKHASHAAKKTD